MDEHGNGRFRRLLGVGARPTWRYYVLRPRGLAPAIPIVASYASTLAGHAAASVPPTRQRWGSGDSGSGAGVLASTRYKSDAGRNVVPPVKQSEPPTLVRKFFDDDALTWAIDPLLKADDNYNRQTKKILRMQKRLRAAACDEAFSRYLKLEEAVNARFGDALVVVARWAFRAGLHSGRRQR